MTHDPDDDDFDPDDPISPAELAHARGFGELIDRAVAGRGVPAAMSADDRALVEVATVIRGAAGRIALTDARAASIVDAALLAAVDKDRPRSVSVPPPLGAPSPPRVVSIDAARKRSLLPWIAATVATAVAAAAIAILVTRPVRHAPSPSVAARRSADQLVGVITRDRAGDAAARIDVIYADRLDGWREQGLAVRSGGTR
ncbi:MAG: hypothetical protein K8W52_13175 [Deltaproteobacteria bacterium]|nr:hypothetical protein [Deltaproteobacteria bacterium]